MATDQWIEFKIAVPFEFVEPVAELFRRYGKGGVAIEEVPLPDAGDLTEEEAWTISPGPARARIGATDVAAVMAKVLPSVGGEQPVQSASIDTSALQNLVSTRLDTVEDTLHGVENRMLESLAEMLAASAAATYGAVGTWDVTNVTE